jgi:superfamily II DNA or RNA helicase
LANLFNSKGFKTIALTGDNSEEERAKAIESLESDNLNEKLIIFLLLIFLMKELIFQKLIKL